MKRDRKSDETGRLSRIQEQLKTHAANQLELPTRALLAAALEAAGPGAWAQLEFPWESRGR